MRELHITGWIACLLLNVLNAARFVGTAHWLAGIASGLGMTLCAVMVLHFLTTDGGDA